MSEKLQPMGGHKETLELVVHFKGNLAFIASQECDRLLLQTYIVQKIKEAFELVGAEFEFEDFCLRVKEQTLSWQNGNGMWELTDVSGTGGRNG